MRPLANLRHLGPFSGLEIQEAFKARAREPETTLKTINVSPERGQFSGKTISIYGVLQEFFLGC